MQTYPISTEVRPFIPTKGVAPAHISVDDHMTQILSGLGSSTLLECAWPLIAIITQLNLMRLNGYTAELKQFLIAQLFNFETRAATAGLDNETIARSRYLLCIVIDELILNLQFAEDQVWNEKDDWTRYSLVSTFYQDRHGGEKFFDLLDYLLINPAGHLPSLEIFLICLNLGFEGKYRLLPQGLEKLALLRERLYVCIMQHRRNAPPASLSLQRVKKFRDSLRWPTLVILAGVSLLAGTIGWLAYLHSQLNHLAAPVFDRIHLLAAGTVL